MNRAPKVARILAALGLLLAAVALVTGFTRHALLDSEEFGDRAVEAIRAEPVREALATELTDRLIDRSPRLLAARPALISATSNVLESRAAGGVLSRSAADLHSALLSADEPSIVLDLADLAVVVQAFLESTGSPHAARFPDELGRVSVEVATGQLTSDAIGTARRVGNVALIAPVTALLLLIGALALAPGRRRMLLRIGAGLMVVAALAATTYVVAAGLLVRAARDSADPAVISAVISAMAGDFLRWALVLGAAGALLAAAAATLISGGSGSPARALWRRLWREPETKAGLAGRHALMVASGLLIVVYPLGALTLAASLAGGYLALLGVTGLLRQWTPHDQQVAARNPRFPLALAGLALALPIAAGLFVAVSDKPGATGVPVAGGDRCNGSAELCDRRIDEIVFPATHNSMAAADAGFFNANHRIGMTAQLDMGFRGLLIDALAGQRNRDGVVRTDLTGTTEDIVVEQIGRQGLASAQRLAGRLAFGEIEGRTDLYLCHVLCELGATPAVDGLRTISRWLDRHPREVLLIFIQDEAPAAQIIEALEQSGLAGHAAPLELGDPLPTLREMIAARRRAAIFAERDSGEAPWYLDGFRFFQDTPYAFTRPGQLRERAACERNRGEADSPMLLVNHWVESYPPNPRNADIVNGAREIEDRARRCTASFGRKPTLLAIDFAERGKAIQAVRHLNRIGDDQTGARKPPTKEPADE